MFECIEANPAALAEDHRVLIQLLSMFENGIGCSVSRAMVAIVCLCVCGCLAADCKVAVGPCWHS